MVAVANYVISNGPVQEVAKYQCKNRKKYNTQMELITFLAVSRSLHAN